MMAFISSSHPGLRGHGAYKSSIGLQGDVNNVKTRELQVIRMPIGYTRPIAKTMLAVFVHQATHYALILILSKKKTCSNARSRIGPSIGQCLRP